MADSDCSSTRSRHGRLVSERAMVELVDALVEAVDLNRWAEIDRLRVALEPFGVVAMFDAELRINGIASGNEWCFCSGEEW